MANPLSTENKLAILRIAVEGSHTDKPEKIVEAYKVFEAAISGKDHVHLSGQCVKKSEGGG